MFGVLPGGTRRQDMEVENAEIEAFIFSCENA